MIYICLVVAALLLYYWPFLAGLQAFYWGDHAAFFEPLCRYIGNALASGRLPLWNPLMGCGQSQIAIASPGLFYPTTSLFALMDYSKAVALQMVLHQLLACVGGFLLVRKLGWGNIPAAFTGLITGFNGYMFGLCANFTLVFTAAWMPLAATSILTIVEPGAVTRSKRIATICGALSSAGMLLGGRPEVWLPGMTALAVFAVYPVFRDRSRGSLLATLHACGVILAGILIATPALLPSFEWSQLSPRTIKSITTPWEWSTSWYDFVTLIFGLPYGDLSVRFLKLQSEIFPHAPLTPTAFFGSVAATLALIGVGDRTFRWRWYLLAIFVFTVCMAAGNNLPVFPLTLKILPFLSLLRYPSKFVIFVDLIVALFAGRGVLFLTTGDGAARRTCLIVAGGWLSCAIVGGAMWLVPSFRWFGFHEFVEQLAPTHGSEAIAKLGISVLFWSVFGLATAIACRMLAIKHEHTKVKAALLCLLFLSVGGSLLYIAIRYCRIGTAPDFYNRPSFGADIIHSVHKSSVPPRMVPILPLGPIAVPRSYHPGGEEIGFDSVSLFKRQILDDNVPLDYGMGVLYGYEGSLTRPIRVLEFASRLQNSQVDPKVSDLLYGRICQMTSTDYVTAISRGGDGKLLPLLQKQYFRLLKEEPAINMRIYQTVDSLPFSYFISKWKHEATDRVALGSVINVERNHFDPHLAVMLTSESGARPDLPLPDATASTIIVPITPTADLPERINLKVHAPTNGVVVVNDNFYPGWVAKVDNKPAQLLRANTTFKAVAVNAGWHDIVFEFKPVVLPYGIAACVIGLLLTTLLLLLPARSSQFQ